jgi:hypothetical protein
MSNGFSLSRLEHSMRSIAITATLVLFAAGALGAQIEGPHMT